MLPTRTRRDSIIPRSTRHSLTIREALRDDLQEALRDIVRLKATRLRQDGPPRGPPPMVDLGKDDDDELRSSPSVHPLLKDYNPHCNGMEVRPQFMNVKKQRADEAKQQRMSAAGAAGTPGGMPNGHGQDPQEEAQEEFQ